jgi:hypothetical protein
VSLRGERFLARHCAPPVESGAKQSRLLSVCLLRKYLARHRLRNLEVKDEIAALVYPEELEGLAMTVVTTLNAHVLDLGKDSIMS